jgi:hypothetical protein
MASDDSAGGRLRDWVLLDGNRMAVTAVFLLTVFAVLGPAGHVVAHSVGDGLSDTHTLSPLFTTQLSGVFLLVSIVVSINSLFVSNEQMPLGRQLDRIRNIGQFRRDLESAADTTISPTEPDRFLTVLTGTVLTRVQTLEDQLEHADADLQADVTAFLEDVTAQTRRVRDQVEHTDGTFGIVRATMYYDYATMGHDLRRIRREYDEDLPDDARDTVSELLDLLEYFATAREYFKTLYFEREFAALSKGLLYVSIPVIPMLAFVLMHLGDLPDSQTLVAGVHTLGYTPFGLLAAYVLRVATVSQWSGAAGQFVIDGDDEGPSLESADD